MYAKVFASLWDGSLRGQPDKQLVMIYLLAHADAEGVVEIIQSKIADDTGLTNVEVTEALGALEAPDADSRSGAEDGRAIVPMHAHRSWGWRIVNYEKYRAIRREMDRTEQNREAKRRERERQQASASVSVGQRRSAMSAQAEGEGEGDGEAEEVKGTSPERLKDGASGASLFERGETSGSPGEGRTAVGGGLPSGREIGAGRGGGTREARESEGAAVEEIVLADGTPWCPTVGEVEEWGRLFPGVDIPAEFRKMRAWCQANGKRRKTPRGVRAFVVGWLTRTQDGGRGSGRQSGLAAGPGDRMKVREATEYREANTKT